MATEYHHVRDLQVEQLRLHDLYKSSLTRFRNLDKLSSTPQALRDSFEEVREHGTQYFNHCEQFVANSSLLGAHVDAEWVTNLAESCHSLLKAFAKHHQGMTVWSNKLGLAYSAPTATAYASMQRMVTAYLPKEFTEEVREEYSALGLPVHGFTAPLAEAEETDAGRQVVISLHGIKTRAEWQRELDTELSDAGFTTIPLEYGYFWALQLCRKSSRDKKLQWFAREYERISRENPGRRISIAVHSFGTHMVAYAAKKYPNIRFESIILCGSIIPRDFPLDELIKNGQAKRVLNEAGGLDFWAGIVAYAVKTAGPSGVFGFTRTHAMLSQATYPDFTHSDYLQRAHFKSAWIPYLKEGTTPPGAIQYNPEPNVAFIRTKRWLLRIVGIALSALILYGVWVAFHLAMRSK